MSFCLFLSLSLSLLPLTIRDFVSETGQGGSALIHGFHCICFDYNDGIFSLLLGTGQTLFRLNNGFSVIAGNKNIKRYDLEKIHLTA